MGGNKMNKENPDRAMKRYVKKIKQKQPEKREGDRIDVTVKVPCLGVSARSKLR